MKSKRRGNRVDGVAACILLALSSSRCLAQGNSHRRLNPPAQAPGDPKSGSDSSNTDNESLKQIWESEVALAQLEAERVLFDHWDIFNSIPTPMPTPSSTGDDCLEGTTREAFLLEELSQITSSNLLTNPNTPQGAAYNFMVNDPLQPNVCTYPTLDQRYALATFYFSTSGEIWLDDSGWLSAETECGWRGIACSGNGRVNEIGLESNNLVGLITEEIGVLDSMTVLRLADNVISGKLPLALADLTALQVLDLEDNELTGEPIPAQMLLLTNLVQAFLSNNPYQSTRIPAEISLLGQLSDLWLANSNLIGSIPASIGTLTNLRTLILYDNELDQGLPTEITTLNLMENLQLQGNLLAGSIPTQVFNLVNLDVLRLDFNFFTGNIPANIGTPVGLRDLRLNDNFMTGVIPDGVGQLTALERVALGSNFLFGSIPTLNSPVLDTVDLARAALFGPIPSFFFTIPTLRLLYLNNNAFTGTIPSQLGQAPVLRDLFLNNNQLVGPVPVIQPGQLLTLNEFTLQANQLTGSMPQSICGLRQTGILFNLFADCGGENPEIQCDFDTCCNRCF